MTHLLAGVKLRISLTAQRLSRSMIGAIFLFIALLFFCAAGWIVMAQWLDPLIATLSMGGVFLVLALIFFLMAQQSARRLAAASASPPTAGDAATVAVPALIDAFMAGVVAGMKAGAGSPPRRG